MMNKSPLVSVIDDDESVRESMPDLLREFGFAAHAFSSAEEFLLASESIGETRCLILDIAMPGMTGLDLQCELKKRGHKIPIIFITAQKDEAVRERAFEQGAAEFLQKPFSDTALLEAMNTALGVK
jgi:FixJ family two-component response regulator